MEKQVLINMLNRDLADEHAAVLRYLVHGWMEGEDTPLGSSLLTISREEMWHMHWLGMIIGQLGGEPNLEPAPYPYDPTSRETILKSYIKYEEDLIPHYNGEAEKIDDPHIKRVLKREAWESEGHARKFTRKLEKLTAEERRGRAGQESQLPKEFLDKLQAEATSKYTEMLQHIRTSWIFQKNGLIGWKVMDQAMKKMRHLAHFSEPIAEDGVPPKFKPAQIIKADSMETALRQAVEDVMAAQDRHKKMQKDGEIRKHSGLVINLDMTIQQEAYQGAELEDWVKKTI